MSELRTFRESKHWNQAEAAKRLGVTQGYFSQLERGQKKMSPALEAKLVALGGLPPESLPLRDAARWLKATDVNVEVARELGQLGYPGFAYHRGRPKVNPAELLLGALVQPQLETRLTEALPWLALHYSEMDWNWAVAQAKLNDAQNRLGFVVTLGRLLAEKNAEYRAAGTLNAVAKRLERSRLEREDTLCNEALTKVERRWLREHRRTEASEWHLLTDLSVEGLPYAQ
jgi:transcriptional regulator with XRE-family HTH domain